uniref:Uncharacterized protein n=1 Tax=Gloeothece verrucosa (strain PCC 7822) TaxID=497965 RepID=E0UI63_GLOV7|nr:conserved hypothetical protein [Gloeothece verrucosa PCC 7822]
MINVSCVLNANHLMIFIQTDKSTSVSPNQVFAEIKIILQDESFPQFFRIQIGFMVNDYQAYERVFAPNLKREKRLLLVGATELKQHFFAQLKSNLTNQLIKRIAAIGSGIILLLGGIYVVSRPCSVGSCPVIPQSQEVAAQALAVFESNSSRENISLAQQRLTEAVEQLEKIPWWSNDYAVAASLRVLYQARLQSLEQIMAAQKKAAQAVAIAQKAPLAAMTWGQVRQLWEQALSNLNQVPPESPFFSFAAAKSREYQGNLISVKQRLQAEEKAQIMVLNAKKAAKIAQIRQNNAQTVQDWQLVYATWQTVLKRLKEIPPGTTLSGQGEQLVETYMPLLTQARARLEQEKLAQRYYNQAIKQAQLALKSQQSKQWSQAVFNWRLSLTSLKQIPANTFTASQAQPLISNYMLALNQAEINLRNTLKFQKIQETLAEICQGSENICNYKITQNIIKVNLTPSYMQQVWQTALQAKAQANIQIQIELLNHISRLEESWQAISNKTQKIVNIYNPQGELMVSYEPNK